MKCKVKKLVITSNDTIGEDEQLYSILSCPSTMLEELWMDFPKLSTRGAIALFTALKDNNKLKMLHIARNNITDDTCDAIITTLKNNCLVKLDMFSDSLTDEAIGNIVDALKVNNTLKVLRLPTCSKDVEKKISSIQELIKKE